jgi:hypothetical protein
MIAGICDELKGRGGEAPVRWRWVKSLALRDESRSTKFSILGSRGFQPAGRSGKPLPTNYEPVTKRPAFTYSLRPASRRRLTEMTPRTDDSLLSSRASCSMPVVSKVTNTDRVPSPCS